MSEGEASRPSQSRGLLKNPWLGFLVSAVAIGYLIWSTNWSEVWPILLGINVAWAVPYVLLNVAVALVIGERWRIMVGRERMSRWSGVAAQSMSMGYNMLLPLRGGDLIKIARTRDESGLSFSRILGLAGIEKVGELFIVLLVGVIGLAFAGDFSDARVDGTMYAVLFTVGVFCIAWVVLRYLHGPLNRVVSGGIDMLPLPDSLKAGPKRWILEILATAGEVNIGAVLNLSVLSTFVWLSSFVVIGCMLRLDLSLAECCLLLFAAVIAFALPSAPSAVGVVHLSIAAGFSILGRPADEGVGFALLMHFAQVVFWVGASQIAQATLYLDAPEDDRT